MYLSRLTQTLLAKEIRFQSATHATVLSLEQTMKVRFPEAYWEFLLTMGHGAGKFMVGSDVYISQDLPGINAYSVELLEENGQDSGILKDAFVFWMHQGYQMAWFYLNEGDNPKIHFFTYTESELPSGTFEVYDSLEDYLLLMAKFDALTE